MVEQNQSKVRNTEFKIQLIKQVMFLSSTVLAILQILGKLSMAECMNHFPNTISQKIPADLIDSILSL